MAPLLGLIVGVAAGSYPRTLGSEPPWVSFRGSDPAAGGGRCSGASGRAGVGYRAVGGGVGRASEVRAAGGADVLRAIRTCGATTACRDAGHASHGARGAGGVERVDHLVPRERPPVAP